MATRSSSSEGVSSGESSFWPDHRFAQIMNTGSDPIAVASETSSVVAGVDEWDRVHAALDRRRDEVASRWALGDELVLIGSGHPVPIPGRGDQTYPFRAHSEYYYLTDRERPGGVLAFDPGQGWVDFVMPVTREEQVWGGEVDVRDGIDVGLLAAWLADRSGRPVAVLGAPVPGVDPAEHLAASLRSRLNEVRRRKDALELDRMQIAQRATQAGFELIVDAIEPGRTEREVQIDLEAAFLRAGADLVAYESVVAGGPNSAVLHFAPTSRAMGAGELVLIDAGAEFRGYACDVTRTYAVSRRLTPEQHELYSIVEAARTRAVDCCTPGTEWRDVHTEAALVIAEGLAGFGLLRGAPEMLVERGAHAVFFPHGVGHMVGLGVRDVSEVLPGRRIPRNAPNLRMDLPLMDGFVVTIEPGLYFVPALLRDPENRERYRAEIAWDRADAMVGFGGIRIEDNVLVTKESPRVLTGGTPYLS